MATGVVEITREGVRQYPGSYDYYCEKKAEREANAKKPAGAAPERVSQKKELRRQRAEERAKIAPLVKKLKSRIETAENKIAEYEKELEDASAGLFNPTPATDFAALNKRVHLAQTEIDRWTAEWEEASLELEKL